MYFDEILRRCGLDAEDSVEIRVRKPKVRTRREFHGNRERPVMRQRLVHAWQPTFKWAKRRHRAVCRRVIAQYEERINQYGYSLRYLSHVKMTPLIEPYAINVTFA